MSALFGAPFACQKVKPPSFSVGLQTFLYALRAKAGEHCIAREAYELGTALHTTLRLVDQAVRMLREYDLNDVLAQRLQALLQCGSTLPRSRHHALFVMHGIQRSCHELLHVDIRGPSPLGEHGKQLAQSLLALAELPSLYTLFPDYDQSQPSLRRRVVGSLFIIAGCGGAAFLLYRYAPVVKEYFSSSRTKESVDVACQTSLGVCDERKQTTEKLYTDSEVQLFLEMYDERLCSFDQGNSEQCTVQDVVDKTPEVLTVGKGEFDWEFDLSYQDLGSFKGLSSLPDLDHVGKLNLTGNLLQQLPKNLAKLMPNLSRIYLDYNLFTSIPDVLKHCKRLNLLSAKENKLGLNKDEKEKLKALWRSNGVKLFIS